ncbi:MAG: cytochrome ubiquinol oxidase subunit I [Chlamydiae bacterium]|nr:cytochrome ubiquinol oxidase subunit I [Chlamydiota bacterium]MBI3267107.1 cytochrome ubiquinol oxidase subunit I [Chlamydiota bacterium]
MNVIFLSRLQFGLTICFHYIFPPLSVGLGLLLVLMEGMYLWTKNPLYQKMTQFWVRIFGLTFAIGVASGIVMEFQFGTNWSSYSRYVGDVFGSALAAEGIFAFFLESGFLAILLFGWNKVGPKTHFFSTLMVSLGSMFSAVWIVVANSWMQTPAGFHLVERGGQVRAEITNFWKLFFNPSSMGRLSHVITGCWQAGAWFVLSVSAYYLLKRKHEDFAKASIKITLVLAFISSILQILSGHANAVIVSRYQPAKLAAMEGHYPVNAPANFNLWGWVDGKEERVRGGLALPGFLSFLVSGKFDTPIKGLNAFPPQDRPPVQATFQCYHGMLLIGIALFLFSLWGVILWRKGKLFQSRWLLKLFVLSVLGPQLANQLGWMTAEVGRQPWIVYGLLRTSEGVSPILRSGQVLFSIILFSLVYLLLFVLFIYLLDQKIRKGPESHQETLHRA